jgi:hypothetical protein
MAGSSAQPLDCIEERREKRRLERKGPMRTTRIRRLRATGVATAVPNTVQVEPGRRTDLKVRSISADGSGSGFAAAATRPARTLATALWIT